MSGPTFEGPYKAGDKRRRKNATTFLLSKGDKKLIEEIMAELDIGMGEAMRTAVRVYHAILIQSKRKNKRHM